MRLFIILSLSLAFLTSSKAQLPENLAYFLPSDARYNSDIPSPSDYLGYDIGFGRHASHDELLGYMRLVAEKSNRIHLQQYGKSHEGRPLLCLTISSPENLKNKKDIIEQRKALTEAAGSKPAASLPAVVYMGYSIHGNETSGSNAAFLVTWYLAACESKSLKEQLDNTVILLDPCFNPDGMQRFSSWVNSRKSYSMVSDPSADEYNEHWPGGRTNHYLFDLNRDWLVAQQPESPGRVDIFQEWVPNVLTDHHEMGTSSTFFFQPGVPSRVNPVTPARNQELTAAIGRYHAKFLSEKGILFYSEENYDDFYYGKGSSYPDVNGCIGILFEQASSRGSVQETRNGLLTFAYTVRNQVITSMSTLEATYQMRKELNQYTREFYQTGLEQSKSDPIKAYVFQAGPENYEGQEFLRVLLRNKVNVYKLKNALRIDGVEYLPTEAYMVPTNQTRYRLVRTVFERPTEFPDSVFYDISAWTLPDAFGLQWGAHSGKLTLGDQVDRAPEEFDIAKIPATDKGLYAYLIPPEPYMLPKVLNTLLQDGIRVRLASKPFGMEGKEYPAGTLIIPVDRQQDNVSRIQQILESAPSMGVPVYSCTTGQTESGPDLGSNNMLSVRKSSVLIVTGSGTSPTDVGEAWHLLDHRYGIPCTLVEAGRFSRVDLSKYNVVILANSSPGSLSSDKLNSFVTNGGTVVGTGNALRWLDRKGLAHLDLKSPNSGKKARDYIRKSYAGRREDAAAKRMPGSIFEATLDLSHPLFYGYSRDKLPMFLKNTLYIEPAQNPYASPAVFTEDPLLAGYIHPGQKEIVGKSAAVVVCGLGRGKVICFAGNPNFRGFWYGTNRMFANAVLFGNLIGWDAVEK